jgi:butyrate kinase
MRVADSNEGVEQARVVDGGGRIQRVGTGVYGVTGMMVADIVKGLIGCSLDRAR